MAIALEGELVEVLLKHNVHENVTTYLLSVNMLTVSHFAGLADDDGDVFAGICVPAGLKAGDELLCSSVVKAWQEAESIVSNQLSLIKKGGFSGLGGPSVRASVAKKPRVVSDEVCVHFSRGKCTFGKRCKFVHPDAKDSGASASVEDVLQVGGDTVTPGGSAVKSEMPETPTFAQYREWLIFLYGQHNPQNVSRVDEVMYKYRGHEAKLLSAFIRKYDMKASDRLDKP
jgi:hypothetical protein